MVGETISHYKVLSEVGRGGMGIVYKAEDTRLRRIVALKFLPVKDLEGEEAKARFLREAQAAAALNHPNIATIYEIDEAEGKPFIAMEYIDGGSLKDKVAARPLKLEEALDIVIQAGQGLQAAHEEGITHRDIKSANIMLTRTAQPKIMDFGLAQLGDRSHLTKTGSRLGTPAYMSPEQALGESVDRRSDIWSLGVVLYEMVSGQRPFKGEVEAAVTYSIVNEEPEPLTGLRTAVPIELDQLVTKVLAKSPDERYQHIEELIVDLRAVRKQLESGGPKKRRAKEAKRSTLPTPLYMLRRPRVAVIVLVAVLTVGLLGGWLVRQQSQARRARETALPEIQRLIEAADFFGVFRLLREAEAHLEDEDVVASLWEQASVRVSVESNPTEAEVFISKYTQGDGGWLHLGVTPLKEVRVPNGFLRWRVVKEGYETSETAWFGRAQMAFSLSEAGKLPPGKVHVPGGNMNAWITGLDPLKRVTAGDFLMDQYEVTNRAYRAFVDQGGYKTKDHWKHPFLDGGVELTWNEGMSRLVDRTGVAGPAGWELGDYPDGQEDYPVAGVSWYEAAAYCESKGERLPTVYHWIRAAGTQAGTHIIPNSNFSGKGPSRVGQYQGLSRSGAYDMAGNVREWCWNDSRGQRYIPGRSLE